MTTSLYTNIPPISILYTSKQGRTSQPSECIGLTNSRANGISKNLYVKITAHRPCMLSIKFETIENSPLRIESENGNLKNSCQQNIFLEQNEFITFAISSVEIKATWAVEGNLSLSSTERTNNKIVQVLNAKLCRVGHHFASSKENTRNIHNPYTQKNNTPIIRYQAEKSLVVLPWKGFLPRIPTGNKISDQSTTKILPFNLRDN